MQLNTLKNETLSSSRIIILICGLIIAFLVWASLAEVDEITRGEGRVIPSQKTQVVQTAEPGVVKAIYVRPGQRIKQGDLLYRLDKTPTSANLGELLAKARNLKVRIERLRLERDGPLDKGFKCADNIRTLAPNACENEERLFRARIDSLNSRLLVMNARSKQKERELEEVNTDIGRLNKTLDLVKKEHALILPMAKRQIVAETELLKIQRTLVDSEGKLKTALKTRKKVEAGLREARLQLNEQRLAFKQQAQSELTEKRSELSVILQTTRGAEERVKRTDIHSPVDGIVNEVKVTTQGAFVNAGDRLVSVVPSEDNLLVEARVKPSDIAFIHVGQPAVTKITAFDFSIFGGLEGKVESVGADTVFDQNTKEAYYPVIIKTKDTKLRSAKGQFDIIAGMVCNVDIITGKKTIMQYLLKPINKARELAFRER